MATSSDKKNVLLMPGTPEYVSSLEQIYGKPGPPEGFTAAVDWLGRKIKDKDMPMKKGELVPKEERKVLVFRDHHLSYPELCLRVAVIGPPEDTRGFPQLLTRSFCYPAEDLMDADFAIFTGGPDVDPLYYDEKPHRTTSCDEERDHRDIGLYTQCLDEGIPMVGVCRGAQFLAVMNGAKLFQDIDKHNGDHKMWDCKQKKMYERISSVHHQCVRPCSGMEVIAIAHEATERWANPENCVRGRTAEIEAFFFRDTCCFGVQGHPEYKNYNAFSKWFLDYIDELIIMNEDIEWRNNRRRLKQEFIAERRIIEGTKEPTPVLTVV